MPSILSMSVEERQRFLADAHVGVVAHAEPGDAAPSVSPVWYHYEPGGDVVFVTAADSVKARRMLAGSPTSFLVQQEAPPQRFVSVSGPTTVVPGADEGLRRRIAERYLPVEAIDRFLAVSPGDRLVTVAITPVVWRSSDFGKLAAAPAAP